MKRGGWQPLVVITDRALTAGEPVRLRVALRGTDEGRSLGLGAEGQKVMLGRKASRIGESACGKNAQKRRCGWEFRGRDAREEKNSKSD